MPTVSDYHSYTAVMKGGFTITTVHATSELDARITAAEEMKTAPLKKYFDGWAHDGYRLRDNGPA